MLFRNRELFIDAGGVGGPRTIPMRHQTRKKTPPPPITGPLVRLTSNQTRPPASNTRENIARHDPDSSTASGNARLHSSTSSPTEQATRRLLLAEANWQDDDDDYLDIPRARYGIEGQGYVTRGDISLGTLKLAGGNTRYMNTGTANSDFAIQQNDYSELAQSTVIIVISPQQVIGPEGSQTFTFGLGTVTSEGIFTHAHYDLPSTGFEATYAFFREARTIHVVGPSGTLTIDPRNVNMREMNDQVVLFNFPDYQRLTREEAGNTNAPFRVTPVETGDQVYGVHVGGPANAQCLFGDLEPGEVANWDCIRVVEGTIGYSGTGELTGQYAIEFEYGEVPNRGDSGGTVLDENGLFWGVNQAIVPRPIGVPDYDGHGGYASYLPPPLVNLPDWALAEVFSANLEPTPTP